MINWFSLPVHWQEFVFCSFEAFEILCVNCFFSTGSSTISNSNDCEVNGFSSRVSTLRPKATLRIRPKNVFLRIRPKDFSRNHTLEYGPNQKYETMECGPKQKKIANLSLIGSSVHTHWAQVSFIFIQVFHEECLVFDLVLLIALNLLALES